MDPRDKPEDDNGALLAGSQHWVVVALQQ